MNYSIRLFVIALVLLASFHELAIAQQTPCNDHAVLWVQEHTSGLGIPGAIVAINNRKTFTSAQGYVLLEGICFGENHIHVHSMGYETLDLDVVLGSDTLILKMKTSKITLDDVEIQGHRKALETTTSIATLDRSELNKSAGGSLATSIQSIKGVNMLQTGSTISKPVIHGMHSNRVLVLNNGIRQEGQQWGAEHAPEIDPFIAQDITVVKGAEAIRYGSEAIGGAVIVNPPSFPKDSSIHGSVNMMGASNGQLFGAAAMLSGQVKKIPELAWRVQGSAKKSGNVKTADYFLENTGSREVNYSAAAAYTKEHVDIDVFYSRFQTELGIFEGAHIGSLEDLETRIANGRPFEDGQFFYDINAPRQSVTHDLFKLRSHIHFSDFLHLSMVYGLQRNARKEYDIRRGGRSEIPSMDLSLWNHNLDLTFEYFNGRRWRIDFGATGNYQNNENKKGTFSTPLIPDYIAQNVGLFTIGKYSKNQFQAELGLRYDYKYLHALGYNANQELYGGEHHFHNFSGSLGVNWNVRKGWDLNSNIGTAWRSPSVNELYSTGLHHGSASFELGNDQLKSEQSVKWIFSVNHQNINQWFRFGIDVYAHYFENYIYLNPTGEYWESLRGVFPKFEYQQANARFLGMDFSAQVDFLKHFEYGFQASVIRAEDRSNNTYLPMIPADKIEHGIRWKSDQSFFLKDIYVQIKHSYTARQDRMELESDFADSPDAYQLFTFNMGTKLPFQKHDLQLDFSILNIGNVEYKDYMNRFRYYAHDLGRSFELRLAYQF